MGKEISYFYCAQLITTKPVNKQPWGGVNIEMPPEQK